MTEGWSNAEVWPSGARSSILDCMRVPTQVPTDRPSGVAERMRRSEPRRSRGAHGMTLFRILGPLEVDVGGRHRPPWRAQAARRPRAPGSSCEPARARRDPDRPDLARGATREGPQRHPDLRLAPPESPRSRPNREPRTRLPPEARSLRVGRCAIRRAHERREEEPPGGSERGRRHARGRLGPVAGAGPRRPRRPVLAPRRGGPTRRAPPRGSGNQDRGALWRPAFRPRRSGSWRP